MRNAAPGGMARAGERMGSRGRTILGGGGSISRMGISERSSTRMRGMYREGDEWFGEESLSAPRELRKALSVEEIARRRSAYEFETEEARPTEEEAKKRRSIAPELAMEKRRLAYQARGGKPTLLESRRSRRNR